MRPFQALVLLFVLVARILADIKGHQVKENPGLETPVQNTEPGVVYVEHKKDSDRATINPDHMFATSATEVVSVLPDFDAPPKNNFSSSVSKKGMAKRQKRDIENFDIMALMRFFNSLSDQISLNLTTSINIPAGDDKIIYPLPKPNILEMLLGRDNSSRSRRSIDSGPNAGLFQEGNSVAELADAADAISGSRLKPNGVLGEKDSSNMVRQDTDALGSRGRKVDSPGMELSTSARTNAREFKIRAERSLGERLRKGSGDIKSPEASRKPGTFTYGEIMENDQEIQKEFKAQIEKILTFKYGVPVKLLESVEDVEVSSANELFGDRSAYCREEPCSETSSEDRDTSNEEETSNDVETLSTELWKTSLYATSNNLSDRPVKRAIYVDERVEDIQEVFEKYFKKDRTFGRITESYDPAYRRVVPSRPVRPYRYDEATYLVSQVHQPSDDFQQFPSANKRASWKVEGRFLPILMRPEAISQMSGVPRIPTRLAFNAVSGPYVPYVLYDESSYQHDAFTQALKKPKAPIPEQEGSYASISKNEDTRPRDDGDDRVDGGYLAKQRSRRDATTTPEDIQYDASTKKLTIVVPVPDVVVTKTELKFDKGSEGADHPVKDSSSESSVFEAVDRPKTVIRRALASILARLPDPEKIGKVLKDRLADVHSTASSDLRHFFGRRFDGHAVAELQGEFQFPGPFF